MPSSAEILVGLETIAKQWWWLAVLWHVYFGVFALALILRARPSRRIAGGVLVLPLFSVGTLAWLQGNPFNGSIFVICAAALALVAAKRPPQPVQTASRWMVAAGAVIAAFGWIYPHFLPLQNSLQYLYAVPTGLIPCPSLSIVIGFSLILCGLGSRAWCLILSAMGVFYGVFGAVKLGVTIDWTLVAAALLIGWAGLARIPRAEGASTDEKPGSGVRHGSEGTPP